MPTEHVLKVQPPYFAALADGSKTFEVRRNDRAFQAGDSLVLLDTTVCDCGKECSLFSQRGVVRKRISFVYSGDPRFGGVEPGYVVLALSEASR